MGSQEFLAYQKDFKEESNYKNSSMKKKTTLT